MSISLPFNIRSPPTAGFLQFLGADTGLPATLGSGGTDSRQEWFIQPSEDGVGVSIVNFEYATYVAAIVSEGSNSSVVSSTDPHPWFLGPPPVEGDVAMFSICSDDICSLVLAPMNQVDSSVPDSIEVTLTPATGAQHEFWEFTPASSPPVVSTAIVPTPEVEPRGHALFPRQAKTSSAAHAQSTSTTITPGEVGSLTQCPPCGDAACKFEPEGNTTTATYNILVGQPVSNCNKYSNQETKTTLGGTFSLTKSFGIEKTKSGGFNANGGAGVGSRRGGATLEMGPFIEIETKISTGRQESIQQSQTVEVTIPPGQMGALVADVTYTRTPGRITIDKRALGFVAVEPELVVGYSVAYAPCESTFAEITMPKQQCSGGIRAHVLNGFWFWLSAAVVSAIVLV